MQKQKMVSLLRHDLLESDVTTTTLNLFRSVRKEDFPHGCINENQPAPTILYPDFEDRELPNGNIRRADLRPQIDADGVYWVYAGGGTSLFDRDGVFPKKYWICFELPEGTVIPDSLVIRFTGRNMKFNADHYQVESRARLMTKEAFKGALDNLARNALARAVELGRKV